MSHGLDRFEVFLFFEPIHQKACFRFGIGSEFEAVLLIRGRIVERQARAAHADTINLSVKSSLQWFAGLIQRKLDARRAPIDR